MLLSCSNVDLTNKRCCQSSRWYLLKSVLTLLDLHMAQHGVRNTVAVLHLWRQALFLS